MCGAQTSSRASPGASPTVVAFACVHSGRCSSRVAGSYTASCSVIQRSGGKVLGTSPTLALSHSKTRVGAWTDGRAGKSPGARMPLWIVPPATAPTSLAGGYFGVLLPKSVTTRYPGSGRSERLAAPRSAHEPARTVVPSRYGLGVAPIGGAE